MVKEYDIPKLHIIFYDLREDHNKEYSAGKNEYNEEKPKQIERACLFPEPAEQADGKKHARN